MLEDLSAVKRQNNETLSLLKGTAQRNMQVEKSKGGSDFSFRSLELCILKNL
jgi:hypothetical protein